MEAYTPHIAEQENFQKNYANVICRENIQKFFQNFFQKMDLVTLNHLRRIKSCQRTHLSPHFSMLRVFLAQKSAAISQSSPRKLTLQGESAMGLQPQPDSHKFWEISRLAIAIVPLFWFPLCWPKFPDGFDSLRARFWHENDRAAFIAKRAAHLVREIFLVRI